MHRICGSCGPFLAFQVPPNSPCPPSTAESRAAGVGWPRAPPLALSPRPALGKPNLESRSLLDTFCAPCLDMNYPSLHGRGVPEAQGPWTVRAGLPEEMGALPEPQKGTVRGSWLGAPPTGRPSPAICVPRPDVPGGTFVHACSRVSVEVCMCWVCEERGCGVCVRSGSYRCIGGLGVSRDVCVCVWTGCGVCTERVAGVHGACLQGVHVSPHWLREHVRRVCAVGEVSLGEWQSFR